MVDEGQLGRPPDLLDIAVEITRRALVGVGVPADANPDYVVALTLGTLREMLTRVSEASLELYEEVIAEGEIENE